MEISVLLSVYASVKSNLTKALFLLKGDDISKEVEILLCQYVVILDFIEKSIKIYAKYYSAGENKQEKQIIKYAKHLMASAAEVEDQLDNYNISFSMH